MAFLGRIRGDRIILTACSLRFQQALVRLLEMKTRRIREKCLLMKRLKRLNYTTETTETAVGEDRRDSETDEVNQCWSVVAIMDQWCLTVGARVEQGRQCGLIWPYATPDDPKQNPIQFSAFACRSGRTIV